LNQTNQILEFPWLIRTGNITGYLIVPFLYLYSRNTFYPGKFWHKNDWLFLLPAFIYFLDMIPFFVSSSEFKIAVMKANLANLSKMQMNSEGWIGIKWFHFIFRYLWAVFMMGLQILLIIRNWNLDADRKNSTNRPLFWYIAATTFLLVPLIVPGIFGAFFHLRWYSLAFLNINLASVLLATVLFLMYSPSILYGFQTKANLQDIRIAKAQMIIKSNEVSTLDKDSQEIVHLIESYLEREKPFLGHEYSIHDLSKDIEIPVYQLSPIINQYYSSNFSSWLNRYRISHFLSLWDLESKKGLTLDALARESGFSNRTTFINAFKKEKKLAPTVFLKQFGAQNPTN
jgi:AraC-like DNA-binding protein